MRRTVQVRIFAALALSASLSGAQPKRPPAPSPTPSNASRNAVPEEKGSSTEAPPQAQQPTPESDLGPRPPVTPGTNATNKLSPLTPAPDEFWKGPAPASPASFDQLLGDIATLRSRVMALTTTLFKSRLRVIVETRGDEARIDALGVTLDEGVVFTAPERFSAEDERVVYEHAVAPGQHVLGIDIERYDVRNKAYRTWQSSRFTVVIPESQLVEAHLVIEEDSDMGRDFPDDQDGEYELGVRLRARVIDR